MYPKPELTENLKAKVITAPNIEMYAPYRVLSVNLYHNERVKINAKKEIGHNN